MKLKTFTLYFEFFGRKMKFETVAKTEDEAKEDVMNRLKFLKIETAPLDPKVQSSVNELSDAFSKLFQSWAK